MKSQKVYKILLTGYYGQSNLGDDYIFWAILDQFSELETVYLTIETGNPNFTGYNDIVKRYPNVKTEILFTGNKLGKLRKLSILTKVDFWIIGGGGLFATESISSMRHLNTYISWAKLCNTKVSMYGIDIDMLNSGNYINEWKKVSRKVEFIETRNAETAKRLKAVGCVSEIRNGCDVTHGFETLEERMSSKEDFLQKKGLPAQYIIWAIAAPWNETSLKDSKNRSRYNKLCCEFKNIMHSYKEYTHVFLPFFNGTDIKMINDITSDYDGSYIIMDDSKVSIGEKRLLYKYARAAIAMRFHGIQFALFYATPFAAISYSPKTTNILKELSLSNLKTEFGIKRGMYFDKEFDLDEEKLADIVKMAVNGDYIQEIDDASQKLKKLSKAEGRHLIDWII